MVKENEKARQPPFVIMIELDSCSSKLDSRFSKHDLKEQKKKEPLGKEILHTILGAKFEAIPFGKDPYKEVEIGGGLPNLVRKQLSACLKENANLFARSTVEMSGID
jgi:hypothetical protein